MMKPLLGLILLSVSLSIQAASPPLLVQSASVQTKGANGEGNTVVKLASTAAHHSLWVAATVADFGGIHKISVKDSQGNRFAPLDQENDPRPGAQTVAHFVASDIKGGEDTVTIEWTWDNYKGALVAEVDGEYVAHAAHIQDALPAGTDNVTAGTAGRGGLVLALSMDTTGGSSDTGGSGAHGPDAGTGFTLVDMLWDWGANLATFEMDGNDEALFSATHKDSYVTVMAVFQ